MYDRERCQTGIIGLDNILNGGIPSGNIVLLSGSTGTGKTTLSIEYLIHGAMKGENGLFVSVTEPIPTLIENMKTFEFFEERLIEENKLFMVDLEVVYQKLMLLDEGHLIKNVDTLLWSLEETIKNLDIRRAVFDSITGICTSLKEETRIRNFINRLTKILGKYGVTTLMTSETRDVGNKEKYSVYGIEEAAADGIIYLSDLERHGDLLRTFQIIKMRGTEHSRARYVIDLTPKGVIMVPLLKWGLKRQ